MQRNEELEPNMKHLTLALAATLILTGCSGDSPFPEATGKGSYRVVNAIGASPTLDPFLTFRVEESDSRGASIPYRGVSQTDRIDDFEYAFNFEVRDAGASELRRIATQRQKIDAGMDYTFVATGSIANPTIVTWVGTERTFDTADVSELRFAHLAESLGSVDVYFAAPGTAPVLGEARGNLAFGEILDAADFAAGDYVLIVTPPDDPATVLFQSSSAAFLASTPYIVSIFDGTPGDTASITARALGAPGPTILLPDSRFPARARFTNASLALGSIDIYNDEMLTNRIVENLGYQATTEEIEIASGTGELTVTPAGNAGVVQIESDTVTIQGSRFDYFAVGDAANLRGVYLILDRNPVEIYAKVSVFHAVDALDFFDIYLVAADAGIADELPTIAAVPFSANTPSLQLSADSYDLIVTARDEKTPLAPPLRLDLANGDVVRTIVFATADPNVLAVQTLP